MNFESEQTTTNSSPSKHYLSSLNKIVSSLKSQSSEYEIHLAQMFSHFFKIEKVTEKFKT